MLTRPAIPSILRLLGRAVMAHAQSPEPSQAAAGQLFIISQMLSFLARRAEFEPAQMLEEIQIYEDLGDLVVLQGLGDTEAISAALAALRAHRALGFIETRDTTAYGLASEVLCLAIDATFSASGTAHDAMLCALEVRKTNQANIVGDFVIGGR